MGRLRWLAAGAAAGALLTLVAEYLALVELVRRRL